MNLPSNLFDLKKSFANELGITRKINSAAPVIVITGSNASGKSFLRRFICMQLKTAKIEAIHLSQQGRASEGLMRCMVYGDENWQSTGSISAQTFLGAIKTSRSRRNQHALIWDEPEIGMSEELQVGSANWLFDQLADWPENLRGVILMTHSRSFVERAMRFPSAKWVNLNGYRTPQSWMDRDVVPIDPEAFTVVAIEKFRRLNNMMKGKAE